VERLEEAQSVSGLKCIHMKILALSAIHLYQRYLSPHKGFSCAYRIHTGRCGCSALGYRAIRMHGVLKGLGIIGQRTRLCGVVHRRHARAALRHHAYQRGFCDIGCDAPCDAGCNLPDMRGISNACNYLSCCDAASCDWSSKKRSSKDDEKYVYIPPNTRTYQS
jgi:uncharacterized protein